MVPSISIILQSEGGIICLIITSSNSLGLTRLISLLKPHLVFYDLEPFIFRHIWSLLRLLITTVRLPNNFPASKIVKKIYLSVL